jgi:hypothetical protein
MKCHPILTLVLAATLSGTTWAAAPLPATTAHGILADRVLPLAHLEELDGSTTAPAAGPGRWRQTLHELRRAAENDFHWPAPREIRVAGDATVPLALIHARYDRMDGPDKAVAAEVLALGALRPDIYDGANVTFDLDPACIFTHLTSPLDRFTLDPADGAGPRILKPGSPFTASYAAIGLKILTLEATLADGRILTARATVDVKRLATPAPTQTWPITATQAFEGAFATGQAYVYLAPGRTTLTNPVIVVEGFDLDNSMDWPVLYDLLNQQNMLEDLRADGYDAVVLDFTEATEPIQRNAFVLNALLAQVNATTAPGQSTALVGASMGGLVARYALTWLEGQSIGHQVRTYMSFDSPHGGANIPLGLQHWLEFFRSESTEAEFLLSRLDTYAARQMLLYHHLATSGTTAQPNGSRAAWLAEMGGLGDWPTLPRKVAVANGSGQGQNQGFSPGDQIIDYTYRSLLVDIDGDVWAVPDGGAARLVFDGGMNLIWPLPDTYRQVNLGGTLPWDNAPGGYRGSMAQMDATTAPYGDIIALHDNHCFVPTVSALALTGVGPFHDIAGDAALMSRTAFDQVYYPAVNQGHIDLTAESKAWFIAEIEAGVSAVDDLPHLAARQPEMLPAAPNPFNPRTEIRFRLAEAGRVTVRVYDVAGRLVRTLAAGQPLAAGTHALLWQGHDDQGSAVASGVYLSRLEVGSVTRTGRVLLAR